MLLKGNSLTNEFKYIDTFSSKMIRFQSLLQQFFVTDLYKFNMRNTTQISELYGVDVSDFHVVELKKEIFMGIDMDLYPPERTHFLVYALQSQLKLPNEKTMIRNQKRNDIKNKKRAAGDAGNTFQIPIRKKRGGRVLNKLAQKVKNQRQNSNSSSSNTQQKTEAKKPRNVVKFSVISPQQIVLKAARKRCIEDLQKWRPEIKAAQLLKKGDKMISEDIPQYFKKRWACQKRRRAERRQLIHDNKKKLQEIYGRIIYQRGWHVSRQQIMKALGILEPIEKMQDEEKLNGFSDFAKMIQEQDEDSEQVSHEQSAESGLINEKSSASEVVLESSVSLSSESIAQSQQSVDSSMQGQ